MTEMKTAPPGIECMKYKVAGHDAWEETKKQIVTS